MAGVSPTTLTAPWLSRQTHQDIESWTPLDIRFRHAVALQRIANVDEISSGCRLRFDLVDVLVLPWRLGILVALGCCFTVPASELGMPPLPSQCHCSKNKLPSPQSSPTWMLRLLRWARYQHGRSNVRRHKQHRKCTAPTAVWFQVLFLICSHRASTASDKSPVVNPVFVIDGWGRGGASLKLNGKIIAEGKGF